MSVVLIKFIMALGLLLKYSYWNLLAVMSAQNLIDLIMSLSF